MRETYVVSNREKRNMHIKHFDMGGKPACGIIRKAPHFQPTLTTSVAVTSCAMCLNALAAREVQQGAA